MMEKDKTVTTMKPDKIALFTMAVGKDPVYFDSVRRYFPYNRVYFGQNREVDYFLLTDRNETIDGIVNIPCSSSLWPYTTLLKNNSIYDYSDKNGGWDKYTHIFFIDADFAIGDKYDFFQHDFVLVKPYWNNKNGGGFFYGGKTGYFKQLCDLFYREIQFIYENKLPVPHDLDEFYLGLFREQYQKHIHLIEMDRQTNTLIFYDNENLDEKIQQQGNRLFMQPYKAEGRANKTIIADSYNQPQECIVNLKEQYIFNNYTYNYGRLLKIDDANYRILWSKKPEVREVLNIDKLKINRQATTSETAQLSPVLSIVMPVYNVPPDYLQESIDSILKQTFGNFELLIINDGSTEPEGIDLIKSHTDQRIRLINNKHDFIDALNKGIAESGGRYIVRMDADDIMLPNRLQIQYEFMEEHPEVDVCGSWMEIFGNGKGVAKTPVEHKQIVTSLLLANQMAHPTVIMRKSTVCKDGEPLYQQGYDCAEDYKLWTNLAMSGCRFANIPETLLRYRSSKNQVTGTRQKEMNRSGLKIRVEYAEYVTEQIAEKEKKFFDFFEQLIELLNEGAITFERLSNIIYQIYLDYCCDDH
jgi:glycosyltransferase involved in cell wall biosynthesis